MMEQWNDGFKVNKLLFFFAQYFIIGGLVKSRLTGENRCPVFLYLCEITGFRLSPE
jgi:hypothetical protein